jgi:hypothetical protein
LAVEKLGDPLVGGGANARKRIFQIFALVAVVVIGAGAALYCFWYLPSLHTGSATPPLLAPKIVQTTNSSTNSANGTNIVVKKPHPDPWHGLMASQVKLEKSADGNIIYAVGKLHNASDHERFGVKVELDVFDKEKRKIGAATDYTASIDAGKDWHFKALVTDRTAKRAKLVSVTEN